MVYWEGHPRSFALHYPYVLAFEPTFVEVRHVETGQMTQIIQGNNLRCLFAEAPPSTTHTSRVTYPQQQQQGYAAVPYGHDPRQSIGSVNSMYAGQSGSAGSIYHGQQGYGMPLAQGYPQRTTSAPTTHAQGRREIIMVSDDRVMALQLAQPTM